LYLAAVKRTGVAALRQSKNKPLLWLLAVNVLALIFFGGRYWYLAAQERREQHKQAAAAAGIIVRTGAMNSTDATKLMELATDMSRGSAMSDADLEWCLGQLKGQDPTPRLAVSRRQDVDMVLSDAVKVLDPQQKGKLFQSLSAQMAGDNPTEEIGIDVRSPAHILGKLGDKRAIPMLETHLNDTRPFVHKTVQKALNRLEGKAAE